MPLYKEVFTGDLKVSEAYLEEHAHRIRSRLKRAADEFVVDHATMFAINMCLHTASSIVLSHPIHLGETREKLRKALEGLNDKKDPTLVLTVCSLYYLFEWDAARARKERSPEAKAKPTAYENELDLLRRGFDEINWLIGTDAMRALGIEKAK